MVEGETFEEKIHRLQELVDAAKHIAFFGGAGVSTESGIPDFRSKDGLYNQHDVEFDDYEPEYLLSHDCLYHNSRVFYEYYRQKLDCRAIEPNVTHKKLAELEKNGKRVSVITQNIDGLHEKAGSREIYNVHGTAYRNYCTACGKQFPADYIFESEEAVPVCPECGRGMVRPDVTMYGEMLPKAFEQAQEAIKSADLMIVAGTSLTVYPAASLITWYRGRGLVVINRDPTPRDRDADLVFRESMGEVFPRL